MEGSDQGRRRHDTARGVAAPNILSGEARNNTKTKCVELILKLHILVQEPKSLTTVCYNIYNHFFIQISTKDCRSTQNLYTIYKMFVRTQSDLSGSGNPPTNME